MTNNLTIFSVYVPTKRSDADPSKNVEESKVLRDLGKLIDVVQNYDNILLGGDFNSFNVAWGSQYDCPRGNLLLERLEFLLNMNDGSPTRVPSENQAANPLDLTWISPNLFDVFNWRVDMENLGSDHLVIRMEIEFGIAAERIKIRTKVEPVTFHEKLKDVDADSIHDLNQFIETIDEIRTSSLKDGKGFRETKYVPKSY